MDDIIKISSDNLKRARKIIKDSRVVEIWNSLGATCNLVGSVKTELLMGHLDIDFHVYSKKFSIEESFKAIGMICENPRINSMFYKNLMKADDMCLEWHLTYEESPNCTWMIDIMHIMNESPYAGVIERVTEKIDAVLTEQLKETILRVKWESLQAGEKIPGIEIYQAVIDNGVENFDDFRVWRKNNKPEGISLWEPRVEA